MPLSPDCADRELITAVIAGDAGAADLFVERYWRFVVAVAARYHSPSSALRDEVPQTVLTKLWEDDFRRLRLWSGEGDFVSYLAPIVRHAAVDYLASPWKRLTWRPDRDDDPGASPDLDGLAGADETDGPETALLRGEAAALVRRALDALGERDREILTRRFFEGQSCAEVARALGMNVNAVHQASHRAMRHLREELHTLDRAAFPDPGGARPATG